MASRNGSKGDRLRVAVLLGGPSSEHDISLIGGKNVVEALDAKRYEVLPMVISREGVWRVPGRTWRHLKSFDPQRTEDWRVLGGTLDGVRYLEAWPADVTVPILHGRFGEDGMLQACLEAAGLPFVGSGTAGSTLASDKVITKSLLAFHGIATPRFEVLDAEALLRGRSQTAERLVETYGTPLVLKDPCGGSSLEVHIADDVGEVNAALQALVPPSKRVMVEQYVAGRELTSGVLHDWEKGEPVALPIVEIRPRKGRSFDYHEKYAPDGAEELCPAPLPPDVEAEARRLGLLVHRLLGLSGLSRTDLILDADGRLHVLEVNTLPGMTERGLVPKAAAAMGISFPALVERLIRTAGLAATAR